MSWELRRIPKAYPGAKRFWRAPGKDGKEAEHRQGPKESLPALHFRISGKRRSRHR
jgi:hypothetical protein